MSSHMRPPLDERRTEQTGSSEELEELLPTSSDLVRHMAETAPVPPEWSAQEQQARLHGGRGQGAASAPGPDLPPAGAEVLAGPAPPPPGRSDAEVTTAAGDLLQRSEEVTAAAQQGYQPLAMASEQPAGAAALQGQQPKVAASSPALGTVGAGGAPQRAGGGGPRPSDYEVPGETPSLGDTLEHLTSYKVGWLASNRLRHYTNHLGALVVCMTLETHGLLGAILIPTLSRGLPQIHHHRSLSPFCSGIPHVLVAVARAAALFAPYNHP